MAITKTSTLTDTIPTIIEEARFTAQHRALMANLVWRATKGLHDGSTWNVPYFGIVTASSLTEGVDMASPSSMADTNVPITPAEFGCQIVVTDKLTRDNQEDIIRAAGRILGDAMEVKRDTDLLDEMDDATTSLGGTGTTLTLGHIAASHALLMGNATSSGGPAPKPYVCVHHPFTLLDLVDVLTPTIPGGTTPLAAVGAGIAEKVLSQYYVGKLFGVPIYEDGNLTISSNSAKGGVFASGKGGGIILVTALEWSIRPDEDPSARWTELNVVGEYGVGEYLAGWIVELSNDATTPA